MAGGSIAGMARARVLTALVIACVFAASGALGQGISGLSVAKNPGNTADAFQDDLLTGAQITSIVGVQPGANATTFTTRYAAIVATDTGIFTSATRTLNANYTITFTVTAPSTYELTVNTSRVGALTLVDDGSASATATTGAATGGQTGGVLSGGSLNLAALSNLSGNGGGNAPFNQSSVATITGVSNGVPQVHTLTFTWTSSCNSASGITGGDECAVRMGLPATFSGQTVGLYPGIGSRVQANDGHFVTVTFSSPCGDGVTDPVENEECDEGPANGAPGSCCNDDCSLKPAGTTCRGAAGACDIPEECDGVDGACPADDLEPAGTVCRAASTGEVCDIDEVCDGVNVACPPDAVEPAGTVCRTSAGDCDIEEECDGVGTFCPADDVLPAGTVCRPSAGVCDIEEQCDGVGVACPADDFVPSGSVCRPATDDCDVAEECTGSAAACPTDELAAAGTVCRASAAPCDAAEVCDGVSDACPSDALEPAGTVCRAAAGACDIAEECDGVTDQCPADDVVAAGTECRASAGECDIAEECDGVDTQCPADAFVADNTPCTDDGLFCTGDETCQGGACTSSGDPCTIGICDEDDDICFEDGCTVVPLACRTSQKSVMVIRDNPNNDRDRLIWRWTRGQSTDFADYGNPATTSKYNFCVYAGTTAALVAEASVEPPSVNWSVIGNNKGYRYKDNNGAQSGVQRVVLKANASNRARAFIKGKGANLPDPTLPFELPVLTQLVNQETGVCFEATYTNPTVNRNTAAQFKAKIK